jgi:hypothetical protein
MSSTLATRRGKVKLPVENLNNSLNQRSIAIGTNGFKNTIAIGKSKTMTQAQEDAIVSQAEDLINNPKFRPFFLRR